jgi:hypothetical protein
LPDAGGCKEIDIFGIDRHVAERSGYGSALGSRAGFRLGWHGGPPPMSLVKPPDLRRTPAQLTETRAVECPVVRLKSCGRSTRYRWREFRTFDSHKMIFAKPFPSGIEPPLMRDNVDPAMPISFAIWPLGMSYFCWYAVRARPRWVSGLRPLAVRWTFMSYVCKSTIWNKRVKSRTVYLLERGV